MRTLIPLTCLQWPFLDIPQQILEIVDMHFRPFATQQQGIANVGELIFEVETFIGSYLGDCSCDEGLVVVVVADGVEELCGVRMTICFVFNLAPTA